MRNQFMSEKAKQSNAVPRAELAFRVGIVGHRPNRLSKNKETMDALQGMLGLILEEVKVEVSAHAGSQLGKTVYLDRPAIYRAVSSLAEGADRIFAKEAIDLEYELVCPMPFHQDEFEKDFLPPNALEDESLERFRELLKRAGEAKGLTAFELDGDRSAANKAYGVAGRVVLNQSDLLVVVWDGGKSGGEGGTVEMLHQAVEYHMPVLWVYAPEPHKWQLLRTAKDLNELDGGDICQPRGSFPTDPTKARTLINETIRKIVNEELDLPEEAPSEQHRAPATQSHVLKYLKRRKPLFNFAIVWKLFRNAVGSASFQFPRLLVRDYEDQIREEWPTEGPVVDKNNGVPTARNSDGGSVNLGSQPSSLKYWLNGELRSHYAWSDKLSDLYADAYRSAYLLTFLLSATAVFVALVPMTMNWEGTQQLICVATEFMIVFAIIILLVIGRERHWHERWMEYRLLAELVRQLRILIPLGGGRPFPRVPECLESYGNLTQTWMYWHMRAIGRATGIPNAKVTPEYVIDYLDYVTNVVNEQLNFHKINETRSDNIAHRLHATAAILFGLTFVSIGVHLVLELSGSVHLFHWLHDLLPEAVHAGLDRWLVLASAALPALGAALAGIGNQGEFARLAKRSAAMGGRFERFAKEIADFRSQARQVPKLFEVVPLAGTIGKRMVDEVADWRVVFIDRPPTAA